MSEANYQNMEHATQFGFTREVTCGVDPLAGGTGNRIRAPGRMMRIPTMQENYLHEQIRSLGGGPDPQLTVKGGAEFLQEFEFLLQAPFTDYVDENDEFISMAFGRIAADGVVTPRRPLDRTVTGEYGWTNPNTQLDTIVVLADDDGTYSVIVNDVQFDFVASSNTIEEIRDGLIAAIGSPTGVDVGSVSTDTITLTSDTEGVPFSDGVSAISDNLSITRENNSWYVVPKGGKLSPVSITVRQNETVKMRMSMMPLTVDFNLRPVQTSGVDVLDLVEHTEDPAHYSHVTLNMVRLLDNVAMFAIVEEFDQTMENNLSRIVSLNQTYEASHIREGMRDTTFSIKTSKDGRKFLEQIARDRPQDNGGRGSFELVIDVPNGFFMRWKLPIANLVDPGRDLGFESDTVDESFAGSLVGAPEVDMEK